MPKRLTIKQFTRRRANTLKAPGPARRRVNRPRRWISLYVWYSTCEHSADSKRIHWSVGLPATGLHRAGVQLRVHQRTYEYGWWRRIGV